ncbi:MAG: SET domain-containing protein [Anaerolineales bacterium]|nr:SET domain-containing protein [Anaerolineales bacterium]
MTSENNGPNSWHSPKLEIRSDGTIEGRGMFARQAVARGERVAVWGGDVIERAAWEQLAPAQQAQTAQVEEGLYLVSSKPGPGDFVNHSCDPNAGLEGQIVIVALRDIAPGEEVTIDYAMCDGDPQDWFDCLCGSAKCRGRVTGDDWKLPELQARYAGHFSPFLEKRIRKMNKE